MPRREQPASSSNRVFGSQDSPPAGPRIADPCYISSYIPVREAGFSGREHIFRLTGFRNVSGQGDHRDPTDHCGIVLLGAAIIVAGRRWRTNANAGKAVFRAQCAFASAEPNDNGGAQGPSLHGGRPHGRHH
jgi:hypothetical protein